eukprot:CAMPEP_0197417132 /NCGR_PEP_ID=MMETSP1170-20131217/3268_1 /TAXON_ID=54406 /ORGANISM="Sarcinochrysis sp, Strain CCMP770" /LENGTH=45 /DNA_ID= /DNA_START= /DNA_END= /DNA_ORIENTATION=
MWGEGDVVTSFATLWNNFSGAAPPVKMTGLSSRPPVKKTTTLELR